MYEDREKYLRDKISFTNWAIKKAKNEGHEIGYNEGCKEGHRKGHREGHKEGVKEGHEEGKIEGRKEGRIEGQVEKLEQIVKSMNENGLTLEQICKISNLKEAEVHKILNYKS